MKQTNKKTSEFFYKRRPIQPRPGDTTREPSCELAAERGRRPPVAWLPGCLPLPQPSSGPPRGGRRASVARPHPGGRQPWPSQYKTAPRSSGRQSDLPRSQSGPRVYRAISLSLSPSPSLPLPLSRQEQDCRFVTTPPPERQHQRDSTRETAPERQDQRDSTRETGPERHHQRDTTTANFSTEAGGSRFTITSRSPKKRSSSVNQTTFSYKPRQYRLERQKNKKKD